MKADIVHVRLSELSTVTRVVPPWETPILRAVHGDPAVSVVGETRLDREPPDPTDEYQRLANHYSDRERGIAPVAQVYGEHSTGVARLAAAIERGCVSEPAQKASRSASPSAK